MTPFLRHWVITCLGMASLGLAGCQTTEPWSEPPYPSSFRERHPIEYVDETKRLEVFPTWAYGLNPRQQADVTSFAHEYRRTMKSRLLVRVPVPDGGMGSAGKGPSGYGSRAPQLAPAVRATLASLQKTLVSAGVDHRNIMITYYPGQYSAAPLVLSYEVFGARVANKCGQWPEDLATGGDPQGWWNETYWNFGCATQSNLAQQAADPLDLIRPQVEAAPDAAGAVRDIEQLREGKNPSTAYSKATSAASGVQN